MRPISKGSEPAPLTDWKKRRTPEELTQWNSLDGEKGASLKSGIKDLLLTEQGFVCCYCERRIEESSSHIEHLASRQFFPKRTFDYSNLLVCCQVSNQCGSRKGSKALKVHPLLPECREYFHFTLNGNILPVKEPSRGAVAKDVIDEVLGLGSSNLNAQRKAAILMFAQLLRGLESEQARATLARIDERDSQGKNTPFASAILGALQPRPAVSGPIQTSSRK